MKDKNKNLTYWWNLPIDELEEMADENGKIKKPKEESEEENNDQNKTKPRVSEQDRKSYACSS